MKKNVTAEIVAQWMLGEIERDNVLYQETAVFEIAEKFGERFTSENERGNVSINKLVLAAFRKISEKSVVWVRGDRMWRKREDFDDAGRQQY
ncbi:hypothetical protein SAMN04515620_14837 [Collimonas sp. OK607]|uniref:DUF6953 family protein n=1 Tax=Collimonas sp. OK607 TaxID=1798194 RepID=UPI0008E1B21F|nr:hypothetical protein [Collimonas sp. OK607]SFB35276.1 hypothetical protein SAMN04515620_14837 [Collimonas sp. OK607]